MHTSKINFSQLKALIPKAMGADRYRLRRELFRISKSGTPQNSERVQKQFQRLKGRITASITQRQWRKANGPGLTYDPALPIVARKDEIIEAIQKHQVVIISGETGSGKTTQIPKFCLAAGRGIDGVIGCTQPRRIAAITVARRIAQELGEDIGQSVGYKIRFSEQTGNQGFIKIMTDGILLAETQSDPYLNMYDTLIIDEAHERSLNIDFLLGILKQLIRRRRDLKLIITSATIDTEKFSKAFHNAPVIEVSGRMYPVEVRYCPPDPEADETHIEAAVRQVFELHRESPYGGDMLIFMPTEQDIRETCELLENRARELKIEGGLTVLPLFARLSAGEQSRVFANMPGRKVIVATNVAETSITIPGIRFVIDSGLARISRYSPRSRTTSLPVDPISKSSADQRKGRCGRVQNGICVRLYPEDDFENRPRYTPPEIIRSNLAEVILRMIALKLGDIHRFPFIDPPAPKSIRDGFDLLLELGAIQSRVSGKSQVSQWQLTPRGRIMARMPIDPRLSRILIEASDQGCLAQACVIVSVLSIQDPRERPLDHQQAADQAHARFQDPLSDFLTFLNIWNQYAGLRESGASAGQLKKFCKTHFLSYRRMREWWDIHSQIVSILDEQGITEKGQIPGLNAKTNKGPFSPLYEAIHKSILSGFLSNIAIQKEKNFFRATKDREAMIFPGSALFNKAGTWIVAAEMVETSRLFARINGVIDVEWIEPLAGDQCRRTYLDPHWSRSRNEVVVNEQVSLYGLVIVPKRTVPYGPIDPEDATEIFIRCALVEADVRKPLAFMKHNRKLIEDIRSMEDKIRRRHLLISDEDLFAFYRERLDNVYDFKTLARYIKKKGGDRFLRMNKSDLFRQSPDQDQLALFPDHVVINGQTFDCQYRFEPGKREDGVTLTVPTVFSPVIPPQALDWLIPGLLTEKIDALIRGLPKYYRKQLVPVAQTVDIIRQEMKTEPDKFLATALSQFINKRFGVDIPATAWPVDQLPDHLKMRIRVISPEGREIRSGRDPVLLKGTDQPIRESDALDAARKRYEKQGMVSFDMEQIPEQLELKGKNGHLVVVNPGLEPDQNCVNLRLFDNYADALKSHQLGIRKLFMIHFAKDLKRLRKSITFKGMEQQLTGYFGGQKNFEDRILNSLFNEWFLKNIRTRKDFYSYAEKIGPQMGLLANEKRAQIIGVMRAYHETWTILNKLEVENRLNPIVETFFTSLRNQLAMLVPADFPELYESHRYPHLERYMKAIAIRAQRALVNFEKDKARAASLKRYSDRLQQLLGELSPATSEEKKNAIQEFFWLVEEFRVSLFAQELKTAVPVSAKRLDKLMAEIDRMI